MATFNGPGGLQADTRKFGPRQFVFRPGGVAEGNTYTDFAELYAALSAAPGRKRLVFDDSITSPCVIPAATYDFTDTSWDGAAGLWDATTAFTLVHITDTAVVRNVTLISHLRVQPTAGGFGTPLKFDSGGSEILVLESAWISGNSPSILAEISGTTTVSVTGLTNSIFGDGLAGVFYFADGAANDLAFNLEGNCTVFQGAVGGTGGGVGNTVSSIVLGADCTFFPQGGFTPGLPAFSLTDEADKVRVTGSYTHISSTDVEGALGDLDSAITTITPPTSEWTATGAAPTIGTLTVNLDTALSMDVIVSAIDPTGNETASWFIKALAENHAGSSALVGSTGGGTPAFATAGAVGWTVSAAVNAGTFQIIGASAPASTEWTVKITSAEAS